MITLSEIDKDKLVTKDTSKFNIRNLDNMTDKIYNGIHEIFPVMEKSNPQEPAMMNYNINVINDNSNALTSYTIKEATDASGGTSAVDAYVEIMNGDNMFLQKIRLVDSNSNKRMTLIRHGVKNNNNVDWDKWYEYDEEDNGVFHEGKLYNRTELDTLARSYIAKAKKTTVDNIRIGDVIYDDNPLRQKIYAKVDKTRLPEIMARIQTGGDTMTTKGWLNVQRFEAATSIVTIQNGQLGLTKNNNPNDRFNYFYIDNNNGISVIGDIRFAEVRFEGYFRMKRGGFGGTMYDLHHEYSLVPEGFMVVDDLDWKWAYNGGGIPTVDIYANKPISEIYFKGNPHFDIGWAMEATGFGSAGGWNNRVILYSMQTFDRNNCNRRVQSAGQFYFSHDHGNIEHVLWR